MPGDPLGIAQLPALLDRIRPDVALFVQDWTLIAAHARTLRRRGSTKAVLYCPIEGTALDPAAVEHFALVDHLVLYAHAARREVEQAASNAGLAHHLPPISVVPHGIDTSVFRPFSTRAAARRRAFPKLADPHRAFIFLNANRNTPRKRIDVTLEAFAIFVRDKPANVSLCLHMGLRDRGWPLRELILRFGLEERVLLTTAGEQRPELSDADLNVLYNACDVGVNTASGEGWGLVAFEHAATRAAQILPHTSVLEELWGDAALLVDPAGSHRYADDYVDHVVLSPHAVAVAMNESYANEYGREELARRAYERALSPHLRWSEIARSWRDLFARTASAPKSASAASSRCSSSRRPRGSRP